MPIPPPQHATQHFTDFFQGRQVTIELTRQQERRLIDHERRLLAVDPDTTPEGEPWEDTLRILIGACIDRGLTEGESDDNLKADLYGNMLPLKRSLKWRLRLAWREFKKGA